MKQLSRFNHGDKETRNRKACERLATSSPRCLLCDETNPHAIELHHVAGRQFDDETLPLCLNHHARVSDAQKDHPAKIEGCKNGLESIGHMLLGVGDLVGIAVDDHAEHCSAKFLTYLRWKLQEIGARLIEIARAQPASTLESTP